MGQGWIWWPPVLEEIAKNVSQVCEQCVKECVKVCETLKIFEIVSRKHSGGGSGCPLYLKKLLKM